MSFRKSNNSLVDLPYIREEFKYKPTIQEIKEKEEKGYNALSNNICEAPKSIGKHIKPQIPTQFIFDKLTGQWKLINKDHFFFLEG